MCTYPKGKKNTDKNGKYLGRLNETKDLIKSTGEDVVLLSPSLEYGVTHLFNSLGAVVGKICRFLRAIMTIGKFGVTDRQSEKNAYERL